MATQTLTETIAKLTLRARGAPDKQKSDKTQDAQPEEPYKYAHLLPVFPKEHFPPLEPYEHVDPGRRALTHPNPRSFLDNATSIVELTPNLGSEIHGVSLANLSSDERDELALEVRTRLCA